jgi:hypothetical protein
MNRSGLHAFVALVPLAVIYFAASAQAQGVAQSGAQSFDQYPSFIEFTASTPDGTQSVLRCGYAANGGAIVLDPQFQEISVMNQAHKSYSRIQRIDNYLIATSVDPSGGSGMLLELVSPDGGPASAKSCQVNTTDDTIHDCRTVSPFTFVDQVKAGDQKIATQCAALLKQGGPQINPAVADPQKTEDFKAALREKVNILAAP